MTGAEEETGDCCEDDADAGAGSVGEDEVWLRELETVVEAEYGCEGGGEDRLVDSSCAANCDYVAFTIEFRSF